jgi:hypothetical protein
MKGLAGFGQFQADVRPSRSEPGKIFIPAIGKSVKLVDWREDPVWDTVQLDASITAGKEYIFFRDVSTKNDWETNLKQSSRLPADTEMIVWRPGFSILEDVSPRDAKTIVATGYMEIKVSDVVYASGPVERFPSGFGLAGVSAGTTTTDNGIYTVGVPAPGAVPPLTIPIHITHGDDIRGLLKYSVAKTLEDSGRYVRQYLFGWVKRAVR